ncbi:hypothetical protein [Butyricicoccus intestinisimiae]|jgi:hypothetical protein|uniref:hypothetical protein n=1 Tax=Butyricicoccus intestinisimiae TaxID=2841509 RepID=UPI003D9287F1
MRKNDYIKTIRAMHMPDDMRARIAQRMAQENEHKEVSISMFKHKKRMAAAVIAATVVVGGSAFAFGGTAISQIIATCSASADYTSLPSAQQCQRDAGFTPALLQSFDNGFAFKDGVIVHNQEQNEDGQTVNKYASLEFDYQKGGETVSLMQDSGAAHEKETGRCAAQKDGVSYYETTKTEKYVSDSYQMTEQDRKEEASGQVEFNVGQSDNGVETVQYHGINWTAGGVHYNLYQMNGSLTTAQMLEMAQQITAAAD